MASPSASARQMAVMSRQLWQRVTNGSRNFSSLPEDIARQAQRSQFPVKRVHDLPAPTARGASSAAPTAATTASIQQEGARIATDWMFPWERRQMQGGKLTVWEKFYWTAFVAAMGLLAYNHLLPKSKKVVEVDENKETLKANMARSLLAGKSMIEEEDDVFEGLSPKEIEKYVASVTNHASVDDPYEGLSPEEIDEYIRTHGDQQAQHAMR